MACDIKIFEATTAENVYVDAINRLLVQLSSSPVLFTHGKLEDIVASSSSHLFFAEHAGEIVGMLTIGEYLAPTGRKVWIEDVVVDEAMRGAYEYDAKMCALNRVGTKAADFRFSDVKGRTHRLYDIKSDFVILFFSNPGCTACMDIINTLKSSPQVAEGLATGRLAVLNIYIDEDLEGWRKYMPVYPLEWYNGFDPDYVIRTDVLYNVRAIPSLYLLDKDKRVIMKDAPEGRLFDWIERFL
jgi:thiol-disulfide isomerase/thioredoxin